MRLSDAVFIPSSSSASDPERGFGRVGEGERAAWSRVGGRWDTQSCTSSETWGLLARLWVFCDECGVVMMMVGCGE